MPKTQKPAPIITSDVAVSPELFTTKPFAPSLERTLHWVGGVNGGTLYDMLERIQQLLIKSPVEQITMLVTSHGGPTGIGMCFYDSVRNIYKPSLVTIGSGDVDSSGIIVFLSGYKRYITRNTTMLLHLAGRTFDNDHRITVPELESMIKEDKLKDFQYASVVSERSEGRLSVQDVLDMMAKNTVLTASDAVEYGLAHEVLG